jgi:hypothetical protein
MSGTVVSTPSESSIVSAERHNISSISNFVPDDSRLFSLVSLAPRAQSGAGIFLKPT